MTNPNTWRTKDGRLISISDMSNFHLLNTIDLIRTVARPFVLKLAMLKGFEIVKQAPIENLPDGASLSVEAEAEELFSEESLDEILAESNKLFCNLIVEAQRRKLKI